MKNKICTGYKKCLGMINVDGIGMENECLHRKLHEDVKGRGYGCGNEVCERLGKLVKCRHLSSIEIALMKL